MSNDEYRAEQQEAREHGLRARHETRLERARRLNDPFEALRMTLAFSSNDWGESADFAWLYGIVFGWQDDEGDYYPELSEKFDWAPEQIERLKRLHANFETASQRWLEASA